MVKLRPASLTNRREYDILQQLIVKLAIDEALITVRLPLSEDGKQGYLKALTDARLTCASRIILMNNGHDMRKPPVEMLIDVTKKRIADMRRVIETNDPEWADMSYADKMSYIEASENVIDLCEKHRSETD